MKALAELQLPGPAQARLELLAGNANEGLLTPEYERFIELEDILATLRLKDERWIQAADEVAAAPILSCLAGLTDAGAAGVHPHGNAGL